MKRDELQPAEFVAVQRLLARYAHLLDEGGTESVAELFTPDARLDQEPGGLVFAGRTAIAAFLAERERNRDPNLPRRHHHVSTIDAWLGDGGVVRATSYFHITGPGGEVSGVYEDELDLVGDGWLIARRSVRVESSDA
jgi:SnoaL-like domain